MTRSTTLSRPPADVAASPPSAFRRALPSAVVITGYLLIGIAAFWPDYPGISQRLFGVDSDFAQSVWFLNWVPHALAHGLNPFFSNAIFVPSGVNLTQSTASPLLGLLIAPFTQMLNPLVPANVLMVLGMPVSATAAFVVLRRWKIWVPAAAIGGLMYGFSPYMVGQSIGHVELIFVPLPPFIALTIVSILQGSGSKWRLGIRLGLLVVAQYLISPEVLATIGLLTVAALFCVAVSRWAEIAEMAHRLWEPAAITLVLATVLLAYPIWMLLAGPQHFTGSLPTTNGYHSDLLSALVPGPKQRVSLDLRSLGLRLDSRSNPTEAGGYIGPPLLILGGFLFWRSRRTPRMQLAAVLLLVSVVLSFGPYLFVDGHSTHIPLPFLLLDHLPLVDDILPSRVCYAEGAFLAAVFAFGLDDLRHASARGSPRHTSRPWWAQRRGVGVVIGAVVVLLLVTQLPQWPNSEPTASVLPATLQQAVPSGNPVAITYPYATLYQMQPMLWQAESGFDFRLLGGYAYHPDSRGGPTAFPSTMRPPGLQQFLTLNVAFAGSPSGPLVPVSPELVATTRTTLSDYDVRLVIVDRTISGSGPVMELFKDALGPPTLSSGRFSMWDHWHSRPRDEQFLPHIVTSVVHPANEAVLSGTTVLASETTAWVKVTKVEFLLTDESHHRAALVKGFPTPYGWLAKWNTASVANGTYSLQSLAYDSSGTSRISTSVPITIKN